MIQVRPAARQTAVSRRPAVRVVEGRKGLDIERFAETLAMLELYVDGMLAATEMAAMDPWVDDEVTEARLASL